MEVLELQPGAGIHPKEYSSLKQIERRQSHELTYSEFYWNYMNANVPIVLTAVGNEWDCKLNWITTEKDGGTNKKSINFNYLRNITNEIVPVADCSKEYYNSHIKLKMPFHDFLDYWNGSMSQVAEENSNNEKLKNLYLKDWHLKASKPNYDFYRVPKQFASDWLNEYLIATGGDDYRFVYMGPKSSWTPFHADVFGSYSWSTNIFGVKKWLLLPPGQELKLIKKNNLPFSIDEELLNANNVHFITLYQQENEALFVPSGWYHQVTNLTDTISVNHNFFNACNLPNIWSNLSSNMQQVIDEIADCRQMENFNEHCQTMLRASFGMNYFDFLDILDFITNQRLHKNDNGNEVPTDFVLFDKYTLNSFHRQRDLCSIRNVLQCMIDDAVICDSQTVLYQRYVKLQESFEKDA